MQIWFTEIKELESLYTSIKGRFPDLDKEIDRLVKADDENMVLLYSRRCLEVIITDLCECELKRARGTEPLKGVIDKLGHEKKVPSNIIASMEGLNTLSTFGTHPKDFDPEQVKPVLSNLAIIIKWYLKYKDTAALSKIQPDEALYENKEPVKSRESIKTSKKRLIFLLSGIVLIVVMAVVALFIFDIIGIKKETKEIEKSIAVLPFINESPVDSNKHFINGVMEEVLNNLMKIQDFRVLSRTSTDQYKGTDRPTIPEIARKLDVNYIVEGSGQKYGNMFILRVQLIRAKGKESHIWANSYKQEIKEVRDYIEIPSQIAQSIAAELKAVITPEEKQLIEKIPTISFTANDFFLRGDEERKKYSSDDPSTQIYLDRTHEMYEKALEYDPTFAKAYLGMAEVYWDKHYWESYLSESFLDSVIILVNKALSLEPRLSGAYIVKGNYYYSKGLIERSVEEYDKALKYNPNDSWAYYGKATASFTLVDYVQRIDNMHKAVARNRGASLPDYLRTLARSYLDVGFPEQGKYYIQEAFTLDRDSATYLYQLAVLEFFSENFEHFYKLMKEAWEMDSTIFNPRILEMEIYYYMPSDYNEEAYLNALNWIEYYNKTGVLPLGYSYRIGMALWRLGKYEEAKYYFNQEIKNEEEEIKLGRDRVVRGNAYYNLAASYAILGEKEKAYKNLDELDKKKFNPYWMLMFIKHDPFFDNIRKEDRFQNIVKDMEIKFQAEHERVRKWLEEQGM